MRRSFMGRLLAMRKSKRPLVRAPQALISNWVASRARISRNCEPSLKMVSSRVGVAVEISQSVRPPHSLMLVPIEGRHFVNKFDPKAIDFLYRAGYLPSNKSLARKEDCREAG